MTSLKKVVKDLQKACDPAQFLNPNRWKNSSDKEFPDWVDKSFLAKVDTENESSLKYQQRLVQTYLQPNSLFRGLLLYHGLGTGKTLSAITIAESLICSRQKKKCVVILPAALKDNFIKELKTHGKMYNVDKSKWNFFELTNLSEEDEKTVGSLLEVEIVNYLKEKRKGIWLPTRKQGVNTDEEKAEIQEQIEYVISKRYDFIHYNGLNDKLLESIPDDFFDNKAIIIDEVHNLTSGLHKGVGLPGKKTLKHKLFKQLFDSTESTFILLSGTPMINEPVEFAYIMCLLRGKQPVYSVRISGMPADLKLENFKKMDSLTIKTNSKKEIIFSFTVIPIGYENKDGYLQRITKDFADNLEKIKESILKSIKDLRDMNGKMITLNGEVQEKDNLPLPLKMDEFNRKFVDEQSIKSPMIFKRRIMGSISYFESSLSEGYPKRNKDIAYEVPMSDYQFKKYIEQRGFEIEKEKKYKQNENSGVYKIFSRATCNFVFPSDIPRPFPGENRSYVIDELDKQSTEYVFSLEKESDSVKKDYKSGVLKALSDLSERRSDYLVIDKGLEIYSPKYNLLLKNIISSRGTSIVYSDFRKVEGLETLGTSFRANDFGQIQVKKNGATYEIIYNDEKKFHYAKYGESEATDHILLKIFNYDLEGLPKNILKELSHINTAKNTIDGGFIKVLMITRSGSEGISLKNVRNVHILEPYWNNIRLSQVIGRANRLNSHIDLPVAERNFTVHKYCAIFSENQKDKIKSSKIVSDQNKTSDQIIRAIADRKSVLISTFLKNIKEASIDCRMHKVEEEVNSCIDIKKDNRKTGTLSNIMNRKAYEFDLESEEIYMKPLRVDKKFQTNSAYIVRILKESPFSKEKYVYIPTSNALYDYENTTKFNAMKNFKGTMKQISKGKYYVNLI